MGSNDHPIKTNKNTKMWKRRFEQNIEFNLQILNRTNNIFELVTVEPVLTERPSDRSRDAMILSDEDSELPDDKKLRLKG